MILTFWSRSKNVDHRFLSNFEEIEGGLRLPDDFFIPALREKTFPSVENAFQACKYTYSDKAVPRILEECTPKQAKSMGSKTGMRKVNAVLNVSAWNAHSFECMTRLARVRYRQDQRFRTIIDDAARSGKKFYHLETRGPKVWGACVRDGVWIGQNKLGKIFNSLTE